jgi:hypothetical protein
MNKWLKENKIAFIIIVVLLIVLGFVYFDEQPLEIGSVDKSKNQAMSKINFGEKVLSFESLDQVEKFEDLSKWGLVAPEQYNHVSGKNLILLAIKANSFQKGDWVAAQGLLGANMLDVDVLDRIGYQSLFSSLFVTQGFKMYANTIMDNGLLADFDGQIKPTKSIIARREGAIYAISDQLESRYIYNNAGNFSRNYLPEPSRVSNEKLKKAIVGGITIYNELKGLDFDDKTLRDTLCVAYASLDYDGVSIESTDIYYLGSLQVCKDTLSATLARLNKDKNHSYNFLNELGWEMQSRGLASEDKILLPDDENNFETMLKIIEKDLDIIEK